MKPAGPVTQPSRLLGSCSETIVRISSTTTRTSPDESIGTKICAASPSSDTIGGETPSCTPSMPAISSLRV